MSIRFHTLVAGAQDGAASAATPGSEPEGWSGATGVIVDSLRGIWASFLDRLPYLIAAVFLLALTWLVVSLAIRVLDRLLERTRLRTSLKDLLRQLTFIGVWLAGLTIAAVVAFPGLTPGRLLTVLGLGSIAIGFAFKDIFENFFAGILILWRFPFDPGDYIECGDIVGEVRDITIRMTLIRRMDGVTIVVPNAMLFKNPVTVITAEDSRRVRLVCGVAYKEDVDRSREVILEAVRGCSSVRPEPAPQVCATEFADSSINFDVLWWTDPTPGAERRSRDEVVAAIKGALDGAEIEIPFPYRTLTFAESLRVSNETNR